LSVSTRSSLIAKYRCFVKTRPRPIRPAPDELVPELAPDELAPDEAAARITGQITGAEAGSPPS
jgi:hypothetical protein